MQCASTAQGAARYLMHISRHARYLGGTRLWAQVLPRQQVIGCDDGVNSSQPAPRPRCLCASPGSGRIEWLGWALSAGLLHLHLTAFSSIRPLRPRTDEETCPSTQVPSVLGSVCRSSLLFLPLTAPTSVFVIRRPSHPHRTSFYSTSL